MFSIAIVRAYVCMCACECVRAYMIAFIKCDSTIILRTPIISNEFSRPYCRESIYVQQCISMGEQNKSSVNNGHSREKHYWKEFNNFVIETRARASKVAT